MLNTAAREMLVEEVWVEKEGGGKLGKSAVKRLFLLWVYELIAGQYCLCMRGG